MDIGPQVLALKVLGEKIDLNQHADALYRYSAARVIVDHLSKKVKEAPEPNEQENVDYLMGRILGHIYKLEQAVMPVPDSYKSPREWWEGAMEDLLVVEMKLRRE